ncbi:AT-hook motif nuclear-localized protein 2 [Brachypodium distachyon]|uniref:AT-hook motif nuclear-localized protein 2 n=1 Tax=Brachypodium distachyon TaxID=15368 RepID=UPI000D0DE36D|nr:AT-hook motif nuclear-localized protein 2 [Brachypodium distachyon]|eukprot:XP_024313743.1 AT-hook motif nuclear-localized protein 2 [Brachypodium distachyon]
MTGLYPQIIIVQVGEGRFEILSLSGSYVPIELDGVSTGTGGLNIILSCTDGRLLSGGVAGPLIAASPVQVVIGRFQGDDKKQLGQAGTTETMGAMNGGSHGELRIVPN